MTEHHDASGAATPPSAAQATQPPDEDAPDGVDAPPKPLAGRRNWVESILMWVAPFSLVLNVWLAFDKDTQEKIAQPGPHIARASIDGQGGAALEELKRLANAFSTQYSNPRIVQTPAWTALIQEQKILPPVALRNQIIRFLTVQNFTSTPYDGVAVTNSSGKIADVGLLAPNSTILVFYKDESVLADGKVTYRLAGTKDELSVAIPAPPRDAVETISHISKGGLKAVGSVPDESDRVKNLLEILNRGAN
jgi:hypothetical protein